MKASQEQIVLRHLKRYAGLTTLSAFERYGISRLSARIFKLREAGYDIVSVQKTVTNRYGDECHIVEYRLKK